MTLIIALYIINCGILCLVRGQTLTISSMFISGKVIFKWTPSTNFLYDVVLTRDGTLDPLTRVFDAQYTVTDVLLYDSITINVRTPGSAVDGKKTYRVSKVKTHIGSRTNISWTAAFFPLTGQYHVFHTYKENRTIFSVSRSGVRFKGDTSSTKYSYLARSFNSTDILFEIRDITLDDAGYYNGGAATDAAWSGGGVVLIVSAKPQKPRIYGNVTVLADTYLKLTCISKSASTPDYYSTLLPLSYTWFVNNTKMGGETRETLRLLVTRGHQYARFSCTATEEDLESDLSDAVQINVLYGPAQLTLTPKPKLDNNDRVTVKEGDIVGPIFCSADCYPPCNITWKYKDSDKFRDASSQNGILLLQSVHRNITQITCLSRWKDESMEKDISLYVQYVDSPVVYLNDKLVYNQIDILEGEPLRLSCFVDGNPTPTVRLEKSHKGGTFILSEVMNHWSNYSHSTGAMCSNTVTYVCSGQSSDLKTITKAIGVNIFCEPRLDKEVELKTVTESVQTRIVIIPVIAYPSPALSKIVWLGPDNLPANITTKVLQPYNVIYQHRLISIISGLEDEQYGEYKLLYDEKILTNVIIKREDYEMPNWHLIAIGVLSALLGITWLSTLPLVIFKKQLLFLFNAGKREEKAHQSNIEDTPQHYDDLQDTDVDKAYTALARSDQETP